MPVALLRPLRRAGAELTSYQPDQQTDDGGRVFVELLELTLTRSETHTVGVEWTQQPIEGGSVISDHGVVGQRKLTVSGAISATPYYATEADAGFDLVGFAQETLFKLATDKLPLEVVTGLTFYPEMYIENLVIDRDQASGQSFNVTIDFTELQRVEAQTIDVPADLFPKTNPAQSLKPTADPPEDGGTQTGEQVDNPGGGESNPDGSGKEPKSVWRKMEDGGADVFSGLGF